MDQERNSELGELQRRCISVILEQLTRLERTNSIDQLPLPPSIIRDIHIISQWRQDLSVLLRLAPFDNDTYAGIQNTPPFSDHFRHIKENGSITTKIDRRATAATQLEHLDPKTASTCSTQFGFFLAATYCLEDHCRRLLPYWDPSSAVNSNPMVSYWTNTLGSISNANPSTILFDIRPQVQGSSDFWLTVIESYWPIAARIDRIDFIQYWSRDVLKYAMEYGHRSCVQYVWARFSEDMRKSLSTFVIFGNHTFIKSVIRAREQEILVEILKHSDDAVARRATIFLVIEEICDDFKNGHNSETFNDLLDCACISTEISAALCKCLYPIWSSLTPQKRVRVSNGFVDLLRYAIEFGYASFAMLLWDEVQEPLRRFEMLFRDECAAFRSSCANGRLELVQAFWKVWVVQADQHTLSIFHFQWASTDQRCRMIGCKFGDALHSAARNGHLSIVRYLWRNMDARVAHEAVDSHGIDEVALSRLIVANSTNEADDDGSHELVDFLSILTTPSAANTKQREPIYPVALMSEMLLKALLLDNGKALNVLVKRVKDARNGNPTRLRNLLSQFDDDQRIRLSSKLTTADDIKLCGLESTQHEVTRLQAMTVQTVLEHGHSDDDDGEEEEYGEAIDLTSEYYEL